MDSKYKSNYPSEGYFNRSFLCKAKTNSRIYPSCSWTHHEDSCLLSLIHRKPNIHIWCCSTVLFYSLTLFRPVFDRPPCVLRPDRLKSALWCCEGAVQWHKNENIDVSPHVEGEILYNFPVLVLFVDLYGTWVTGSLLSYRAAGLYAACAALSCVCSALGWIVCCVLRSIFFPPTTKDFSWMHDRWPLVGHYCIHNTNKMHPPWNP